MQSTAEASHLRKTPRRPTRWRRYVDSWPDHPVDFATRLRSSMVALGLTQEHLSRRAGLSEKCISSVLQARHWATHQTRLRLIRAIEAVSLHAALAAEPDPDGWGDESP